MALIIAERRAHFIDNIEIQAIATNIRPGAKLSRKQEQVNMLHVIGRNRYSKDPWKRS